MPADKEIRDVDESVKKILIVDDEAYIRQSFADYFEDIVWETIEAESAESALALLEMFSPDGAVVDIRMRGMRGDEFIRQVYDRKPQMVFIICSGSPEYEVPVDLKDFSRVSNKIFRKPVIDLESLKDEFYRLMEENKL